MATAKKEKSASGAPKTNKEMVTVESKENSTITTMPAAVWNNLPQSSKDKFKMAAPKEVNQKPAA